MANLGNKLRKKTSIEKNNETLNLKQKQLSDFASFAIESLSDGAFLISKDASLVYVNRAACKQLGYTKEELLSMRVMDFNPHLTQEIWDSVWGVTIRDKIQTIEVEHLTKDGRLVPFEVLANYIEINGEQHSCSFTRDITKRKKAKEEIMKTLSLLNATIESTVDGILVVDREGKIEKFNQKFIQMWEIPASIVESRNDDDALAFVLDQLKDHEAFLSKVKTLYAHPERKSYDVVEFKDGKFFERYSQPQEIGGKILGRVWSFRDVTDRKKALEALKRNETELKERVKELEEFYDMAVGRELKMVALKKEIAQLKEQIEKFGIKSNKTK